ncbi:MAG: protein kinase [Helicobacteraceae bacterium]|nr:protein kinase [Helicobacteraceae bacterium]
MEKYNSIISSCFGLAKANELLSDDAYEVKSFNNTTVAVLCDGVGSAEHGREAAQHIVTSLLTNFKNRPMSWSIEKSLLTFIENINQILYNESQEKYEAIEYVSTLCIAVIEDGRLYGANVGDSRIYLLRDEKLTQLTQDHILKEEGMDHVLTRAMGLCLDTTAYYFENNLLVGDKLLLCSDGLYNTLSDEELQKGIASNATTLVKKATNRMNDDLHDDTSAITLFIDEISGIISLKSQPLPIPKTLKKGDLIDGYTLQKSLIQNDRTWLVSKDNDEFVLKFPPLEAIEDEIFLDIFVKEAWNASRLKAGFFAKAWIPHDRSSRYYVMDYAQGVTLKEYIKKKPIHIDDSILLAKFLLKMNQFLLKFDLVHGDIKPENIIVNSRDKKLVFKMIDYGSIVELFSINSKAGTPSYLAPERFKGSSINEQSEIFSIGVTLYEALTLKYPYGEIEPFQNPYFKEAKSVKKLNNNIPLWLESIVLKSTSAKCDDRYGNYSEMLYDLEHSQKVKPYFLKETPLLHRNPLLVYKIGFIAMLIVNVLLMIKK